MAAFRNVGSGDSHCSVLLIVNAGTVRVDRAKGERKKERIREKVWHHPHPGELCRGASRVEAGNKGRC